ncbi:24911_t:CDS:2 [Cetraspora pellucida]|uniref:24911_t:CDS:1 n=1 Tax=Cetraspora pellucida TaxID=1433469 RepID=A0A9N9C7W4_9GLOM|nr:24911_t:CDS:2 [Cetraspora pellucida]
MANARCLSVLKLMAPALAKFPSYMSQKPSDDYLNKLEHKQNLSERIPEKSSQIANQVQALPSINLNILVQQKTENQTLVKKVTKLESQMAKQTASQTVEPVRQPRSPPPSLQTEKGIENYHLLQYLNNLGIFSTEDLEINYPIKPFQKPYLE